MNDSLKITLLKLRIICEGLKKALDEANKELKQWKQYYTELLKSLQNIMDKKYISTIVLELVTIAVQNLKDENKRLKEENERLLAIIEKLSNN